MTDHRPPTIDPTAAAVWALRSERRMSSQAPWLHEEIGLRMQERLQWIKKAPTAWAHWGPIEGGVQTHKKVALRYPNSVCYMVQSTNDIAQEAIKFVAPPVWSPARWWGPAVLPGMPAEGEVQLVWANMLLHSQADPVGLIRQWHRALAVDGFLMFSCLGPDTVRELQSVYDALGLGPCSHTYTDMHDWGDMLVHAGFAEPVMDMERVKLSFATPERALQELRGLGRNFHPQRFSALRGRNYRQRIETAMRDHLASSNQNGSISLTFEVIYGHAYRPAPKIKVSSQSAVSMRDMKAMLAQGKPVLK